MVTQNRRIGGVKHETTLKETIKDLSSKRYHVIDLEGKSPTLIATKNGNVTAIRLGYKPTQTKLRQMYHMFDEILRLPYKENETRQECIQRITNDFENRGYRIIRLGLKSPDAIAIKDNKIYAIEILGITHIQDGGHIRNRKNWAWTEKQNLYSMFDGLMIKTFFHDHPDVLTDVFIPPNTTPINLFADGNNKNEGEVNDF